MSPASLRRAAPSAPRGLPARSGTRARATRPATHRRVCVKGPVPPTTGAMPEPELHPRPLLEQAATEARVAAACEHREPPRQGAADVEGRGRAAHRQRAARRRRARRRPGATRAPTPGSTSSPAASPCGDPVPGDGGPRRRGWRRRPGSSAGGSPPGPACSAWVSPCQSSSVADGTRTGIPCHSSSVASVVGAPPRLLRRDRRARWTQCNSTPTRCGPSRGGGW